VLGAAWILLGLMLFVSFFAYQRPGSEAPFPTGPWGHYLGAMAGCALVAWGGALFAAAREPALGRGVGMATAVGLVGMALYRMVGWLVGDYYAVAGDTLRVEAGIFLLVALALVWLRPPRLHSQGAAASEQAA